MKASDVAANVCEVSDKVNAAWDQFREAVREAEKKGFTVTLNCAAGGQQHLDVERRFVRVHAAV